MTAPSTLELRRWLADRLNERRPQRIEFHGLLGDGNGNVIDGNNEHWVMVRRENRSLVRHVLNLRVGAIEDLPVLVGYSDEYPYTLQILSIAGGELGVAFMEQEGVPGGLLPNHHQQHEWRWDGSGGNDVVWLELQQILNGLVYPSDPAAMTVEVYHCKYLAGTTWHWFDSTTSADLTARKPAAGFGRWVLISIDSATNALQYTNGTAYVEAFWPADEFDNVPAPPAASVPLAAIYLTSTTTAIGWDIIYDVRNFPGGVAGTVTATAHSLLDGSVHDDTVANDPPVQGDMIYADAGLDWDALAIGGAGALLYSTGALPAWLALGNPGDLLAVNALGTLPEWQPRGSIAAGDLGTHFEPLTNGDPVTPELIFDGDGDVIMVEV